MSVRHRGACPPARASWSEAKQPDAVDLGLDHCQVDRPHVQAARRSGSWLLGLAHLPETMRYRRSPSVFSDSSVSLSFLRTTPAKNPRTECCCQPVAFMMAAMVVPLGWLNIANTFACLEFERGVAVVGFSAGAAFCRPLPAGVLVLVLLFFFDMSVSSHRS